MPNSKSAEKRLRQNSAHRDRNKATKSEMRTEIKKVVTAVQEGDLEKAETQYVVAAKKLDRAGAKNIIHPNAAARKKSRLQALILKAKKNS